MGPAPKDWGGQQRRRDSGHERFDRDVPGRARIGGGGEGGVGDQHRHRGSHGGLRVAAGPPCGQAAAVAGRDLTYGAELLQRGQLPGVGNRRRLAESTRKILALQHQQPGLVVLPAHDPTAAQRLVDS